MALVGEGETLDAAYCRAVAQTSSEHATPIGDRRYLSDTTLLRVANALQAGLRTYDIIIRYGGDEFVCVISGLGMAEAEKRFERINTDLAGGAEQRSITVGFARMQPEDTPEGLVARADAALYEQRHSP